MGVVEEGDGVVDDGGDSEACNCGGSDGEQWTIKGCDSYDTEEEDRHSDPGCGESSESMDHPCIELTGDETGETKGRSMKASYETARPLVRLQERLGGSKTSHEEADDPELGCDVPELAVAYEPIAQSIVTYLLLLTYCHLSSHLFDDEIDATGERLDI